MFSILAGAILGKAESLTPQCKTCIADIDAVDLMKQQVCDNAQAKMKLLLASRLSEPLFCHAKDILCFSGTDSVFALQEGADTRLKTTFEANNDGVQMMLSYVVWKQECHTLEEGACKSAASRSPCQWNPLGGASGTGQCVISDRMCVQNTDVESCEENARCRWIPHEDIKDVSYVPCRFVRNFGELCAAYTTSNRCSTNKNCLWNDDQKTCGFNACVPGEHAKIECACSSAGADPSKPAEMCHYGQKCVLADVGSDGPYVQVEGGCEAITPPTPEPFTCAAYWKDHCKPAAADESKTWRPLWNTCMNKMPESQPFTECCRRTCDSWIADGNTCSAVEMVDSTKLCGIDRECNQETCCRPTCASFDCNAQGNMPTTLDPFSVLKSSPAHILCADDGSGSLKCNFDLCCEITCASKSSSICHELANPPEFIRPNAADLLCRLNPNAQGEDVAEDGCNNKYCCQVNRVNCQDVIDHNEGQCGEGALSDWIYSPVKAERKCGPSSDYKCGEPSYCCTRRCSEFLAQNSCPANEDSLTQRDFVCDHDCSIEQCCTKTCANFECATSDGKATGMFHLDGAANIICVNPEDCSYATCCQPTCLTHQLSSSATGISPFQTCEGTGMQWRDTLIAKTCGAPGSSTDCMNGAYCCQKTCEYYTSTAGCPSGYTAKNAVSAETCGDAGTPPCGSDYCCLPTCEHFINNGGPGCNSAEFANKGWTPITPLGASCSTDPETNKFSCNYNECCERTCANYIESTVTTEEGETFNVCSKTNLVPNTAHSATKCNAGCNEENCCEHTCRSTYTCVGLGVAYQGGKEFAKCSANGGECTVDFCCETTCAAFQESDCDVGYIKDSTKDVVACAPRTGAKSGTVSDCDTMQCCKPTCESFTCSNGYVRKDVTPSALICEGGQCTADTCCDTTCETYFGLPAQCGKYEKPIENAVDIKCKHGEECAKKCCMSTCASWLKTQGLEDDATCGINPVAANNGVSYTGGVKKADGGKRLCADNEAGGECSKAYCCEYTCAKFYAVSCVNTLNLGINPLNAQAACSANKNPPSAPQEGLERFFPCDREFCCADPCSKIQKCPENEEKRNSTACQSLTSCNVKDCCVCADDKSCISSLNTEPAKSCQISGQYPEEVKSCKSLEPCAQSSNEVVSTTCTCGAPGSKGPHVCRSFKLEHCHANDDPRCVPECRAGGNSAICQCGKNVCAAQSYCDKSDAANEQCINCGNAPAGECNLQFCKKIVTSDGDMCVPTSAGAALIVAKTSTGGLGAGAIAGIAVGAVALFAAGVVTARLLSKPKRNNERGYSVE